MEALDGLVAAVSAATGSAEPPWLEAYRSIIGDEFLDRHHVGLTVGLIRSSRAGPEPGVDRGARAHRVRPDAALDP